MAYAKGLPVVSTAVILQKSAVSVIFPADSGIKKLTDLYGKTLGVPTLSVAEKQWRFVEKFNKLDASKINEVSLGTGIAQMIEARKVDASLAFFFNDGLKAQSDGIPMSWILLSDVGLPIYSDALIVNENTIKKIPIWSAASHMPTSRAGSTRLRTSKRRWTFSSRIIQTSTPNTPLSNCLKSSS